MIWLIPFFINAAAAAINVSGWLTTRDLPGAGFSNRYLKSAFIKEFIDGHNNDVTVYLLEAGPR